MFKPYHRRFLKVKIKSLSAESRIIRQEEKKSFDAGLYLKLYYHRVVHVREEVRVSFIAYAYLRGKALRPLEGIGLPPAYIFGRAHKMVRKFGTEAAVKGFRDWFYNQPVNA